MSAEGKYFFCFLITVSLFLGIIAKTEIYELSILWFFFTYPGKRKSSRLYTYFKKKELEKEEKLKEKTEDFFKNYSGKIYNDKEVFIKEGEFEIFIKIKKKQKKNFFYIKKTANEESKFKYHICYKKGLKQFFKTKIYKRFKNLRKVQKRRF